MRVVYLDIDSLRPDHIGAYGYDAPTTPNIDKFTENAVLFERGYTANSPCMPSRSAFSSGRYGINNGVTTHGTLAQTRNSPHTWEDFEGDARDWWTLPELFFNDRAKTVAISTFPQHTSPWFYHLWHEFVQPEVPEGDREWFQTVRGETIADHAIEFVRDEGDDDFFLYAQFWDPHGPYKRSAEEAERFADVSPPPYPTKEQLEEHQSWDAWRSPTDPALVDGLESVDANSITDRSVLSEVLSYYDAEIRYADRHVGRVLDALKDEGVYDDTLIILTADHGEEFGEHGLYREHWSTHDGTQRVPFIVKPPADKPVDAGSRKQFITNVDMSPTIADYAGLDAPSGWQGRSVRPIIEDASAEWRDTIVVDHGLYTVQRAVRTDRWKFVRTYHPGMWGGVVPDRQLFDMKNDPWEQEDVSTDNPDVVAQLEEEMVLWAERHRGRDEDSLKETTREGPQGVTIRRNEFDGV